MWQFPFVSSTQQVTPIEFASVSEQSELQQYEITNGKILSIDGIEDPQEQYSYFTTLKSNQSINLSIGLATGEVKDVTITTYPHTTIPDRGMMGISGLSSTFEAKEEFAYLGKTPIHVERVFYYLWFLNIGIGIMNLLPLWITDGGKNFKNNFHTSFQKKSRGKN